MRNNKKSLINFLQKKCTKRVRICTSKFCASGCLVENYEDDNIVCLENVEIYFSDANHNLEHRESLCICDDNIIAFEALSEK